MQYTSSNKKMVQILVQECINHGIKNAVISPGSRNAPLIIAFDNNPDISCFSIPDERSAAFYALGMARQLNEPVAIICTSGTAVLNYAPAITEAYYQNIPLIAITADRPPYLIDQEDGQTIRQHNVFANHINYSCTLPIKDGYEEIKEAKIMIAHAYTEALLNQKGPVHINIPFEEPLYESEIIDYKSHIEKIEIVENNIPKEALNQLIKAWNSSENIMILVGVNLPNTDVNTVFSKFAKSKNCVVLAPVTANINGSNTFNTIESLFYSTLINSETNFAPDLLLTFGGPVVSKAAKQFLRKYKPKFHFDIDTNPVIVNTYQALTQKISCTAIEFYKAFNQTLEPKKDNYIKLWYNRNEQLQNTSKQYFEKLPWSDLRVFVTLFQNIAMQMDIHLANSTPVRYAELFNKNTNLNYYCNRGTSGIDGSTSTAAGSALASNQPTLLITGDISFFYDSNAFWNNHVPKNLKVILINNGGGNIFKVIRGPESTKQLESLFVSKQHTKTQKLCEAFDIEYISCDNDEALAKQLSKLFDSGQVTVLEVFTPSDESANNYRGFFKVIKEIN